MAVSNRFMAVGVVIMLCTASCAGFMMHRIHADKEKWISTAQTEHPHPGDDLAAMLDYLDSTEHSLVERNHMIWAVGQCRDPRAMPALMTYYTGKPCDHEQMLCQYELKKAIDRCSYPRKVRRSE